MKEKFAKYSLEGNSGWDAQGGEILEYIGLDVVFLEFTKVEETGGWKQETSKAKIEEIGDFDPMTGTYAAKLIVSKEGKEEETIEKRIISAGFLFGDPEENGYTFRLVPFSQHYKFLERGQFFERLGKMYEEDKGVIGVEQLQAVLGKSGAQNLRHILNLNAVIDTNVLGGLGKGIHATRISEVLTIKKLPKFYEISFRDNDGTMMIAQKFQKVENTWICQNFSIDGTVLGNLKFIDIETPRETVKTEVVESEETKENNE